MARAFTIPTSFEIKGKKVNVVFDDKYCSDEGLQGEADFTDLTITLCRKWKGHKFTKAQIEQVFFHELAHIVLHLCGQEKLKYNEELVEDMGLSLRDFFRSCK